jgi:hypothetical protein
MVDSSGNKYTYWVFTIQAIKGSTLPGEQSVIRAMTLLSEKYVFQLERATSLHYQGCCKTRIRKRQQTVLNEIVTELDIPRAMVTVAPMQGTWEQAKAYCTKSETGLGQIFTNEVIYTGKDIEVLDDEEGRYPWQQKVVDIIFDKDTSAIKVADDRTLIWITCTKGGTGKSKLVKWCCVNHDNIVKISFGSAAQLRSSIIAAGPRQVYFIDIPRTLGTDDSIPSLISSCEDLKNGYVVSSMYGKNDSLILDPPHIIIFSNKECPRQLMSEDRWKVYHINYALDLIVEVAPGVFEPWKQ